MKRTIIPEARAEIEETMQWYQTHGGVTDRFLDELVGLLFEVQRFPRRFPRISGYRGPAEIRRALLDKFPYQVIYQLHPTKVRVISISHTSRRPRFWVDRVEET